MVRQGSSIGSSYGNYIPALIVVAADHDRLNFALSAFADRLEAAAPVHRGPAPLHADAVEQEGAPGAKAVLPGS